MKAVINTTTGQEEVIFEAKLLSISAKPLENVNKTLYRPGTVEFKDASGKTQQASCLVYENNYNKGMVVGQSYSARAVVTDNGSVLITVSHLSAAARPDETMFSFGTAVAATVSKPLNS
jgi:hypothetical protein